MAAIKTPCDGPAPGHNDLERLLTGAGATEIRWWSNGPGDRYDRHAHGYHKVLFCAEGSITFLTADGSVSLAPGDRLDVEPNTEHSAVVGARGVTCVEGPVPH